MKISVITPTKNRDERLQAMYRCFAAQTWAERELLILDDSPAPSPFFSALNDPRVIYKHLSHPLVLGEKRNRMVAEASGDFIAHFDDDDLYAPTYLEQMMAMRGSADFFTLSGWFAWVEKTQAYWYWDTEQLLAHRYAVSGKEAVPQTRTPSKDPKERGIELNLWGYGFTYLYKRAIWEKVRFPQIGFGEDYVFARKAGEQKFRRAFAPDHRGLALHILHGTNTSAIYPQYALPRFAVHALFGPWLKPLLPASP
jgi:glycosyltransferase involved in cell wall biosynthesis